MSENTNPVPYDKSDWGQGPWMNEPDRVDFIHAGFSCFIQRNMGGAWCGYVGVPKEHPAYGMEYDELPVNVHGGITYSAPCAGHICHVPQPGMPDEVMWFGFDTAHSGDYVPSRRYRCSPNEDVYRNQEYVTNETKQLAEQLKEMAK